MSRMANPDFWEGPPEDRRATVERVFREKGIPLDRAPGEVYRKARLTWQSVASWPMQFAGLHRCNEHPRLERLMQMQDHGPVWTYFVNGLAMPSIAAALEALPAAEKVSRYPGHGQTFLTFEVQKIDQQIDGNSEVDAELESLEASRHE